MLYTPLLILYFRIPHADFACPPNFAQTIVFKCTQKLCIMENSKIVNTWKFLSIEITLSFRGEYYNTFVLFPQARW